MCVCLYAHVHMCVLDSEETLDKESSSRGALSACDVPGTLPWPCRHPCRHRCIHRSGSHNCREAGIIMTHFTDEELDVSEGEATCSGSHS